MSAIDFGLDRHAKTRPEMAAGAIAWRVDAVRLADVEADWRRLERDGIATPYQRFDWVAAYAANALAEDGGTFSLARVASEDGRTLAFLPFVRCSGRLSACASFIGGKHANLEMGVFDRAFADRLDADGAMRLLRAAGDAAGGVDCFVFRNQPVSWDGVRNPLAQLASGPSPEPFYRLSLSDDVEADLTAALSSDTRRKQRKKRAKLAERGPLRSFVATTPDEIERALAAFHAQKAVRFSEMGAPNPFASAGMRRFFSDGAALLAEAEPALRIIVMELDGQVIATWIGAVHAGRWTGMTTAFDTDPELLKLSPGELLLTDVVRLEHELGTRIIDLGVGDAAYKARLCKDREELVESHIALTALGRVKAKIQATGGQLKAAIKRSPIAHRLALRLQRANQTLTQDP